MKDKEYHVANFATFVSKTLSFSPQKMDELNFRPVQYCINKIIELTKSCIWAISKWMQLSGNWTSCCAILVRNLILVISNWTCAVHSFNFEITHMISAQIALHSVQLPLKNEAPENITITLSACSKIKHWDTITSAVDHMIFILQKCFFHIWL